MSEETAPVSTERVFVTAEIARKWLRLNLENNRPINNERVNQYGRDMKGGRWKENGDTIKFAEDGSLIDGQHRLSACVACGVGFWSLVARGVQKDAFITIDRNQTRSTGQLLHLMDGVTDYNAVAGVLSWLWRFRDGIMLATRHPTSTESFELLQEHPGIKDSIPVARRVNARFKAGPNNVVAICHYLFTRQDATLAEAFFEYLATGANLREIDPVFQLRARIISAQASKQRSIGAYELVALFFKAWLAEREGRTIKGLLRWSPHETFPNIGPIDPAKKRPDLVKERIKKSAAKKPAPAPAPPAKPLTPAEQLRQKFAGLDKRG